MENKQDPLKIWVSDFGKEYTNRNHQDIEKMDVELGEYCGCGRKSHLFQQFLPTQRISVGGVLEVGSNVGTQLKILQKVNPELSLYALEPQAYAIDKGKELFPDINFIQGNALSLPYADNSFEVVMTNTVLIHIQPAILPIVMAEIYRCCIKYIHFHEYYAESVTSVNYREYDGILWKTDFMKIYLELFPDLVCVNQRLLHYRDPENGQALVDQVCLLEKK